MAIMGNAVGRVSGLNLLATGVVELLPQEPQMDPGELNFLPQFVYVVCRTLTGSALTVSPKIRIGSNGTHDNVAPLFTVPLGVQVNVFAQMALVSFPMTPVNLRAGPVSLEVQQAGVGPTTMTGDCFIVGFKVS